MKGLIKIVSLFTVAVILTACCGSNNCCNPCAKPCCPQPCCPQSNIWDNSNCCGSDGAGY